MANDPEIKVEIDDAKNEIDDAKEDLRDALHQINNRVEEHVARLRPDRGIRKHPVTTTCIAGALGFALGSDSGEAAIIGLLALGAALMLSREKVDEPEKVDESVEIEPI
jgi:hypothetical protein